MPKDDLDKSLDDLLAEMYSVRADSPELGRRQALIQVRTAREVASAVRELRDATKASADASDTLGRRVFAPNAILTLATVLAAVVALATFVQGCRDLPERAGDLETGGTAGHELLGVQVSE